MNEANTNASREAMRQAVQARADEESATLEANATERNGPQLAPREIEDALADDEYGDSVLLTRLLHNRFIYSHAEKLWFLWRGSYWEQDATLQIIKRVNELIMVYAQRREGIETLAAKAGDKDTADGLRKRAEEISKRIKKLNTKRKRENIVSLAACGEPGQSLGIKGDEWDVLPLMLPVANGVVDLKTGELLPGRPDHWVRTFAPVMYDRNAACPTWERFLLEIFDQDAALADFMRRLFGYAVCGNPKEHVFAVLWGADGRNGKSTLIETLQALLNDLAWPIPTEMLLDQGRVRSSAGPSPDLLSLKGKRVAIASESDAHKRFSPAAVKKLSGGDTIAARGLYSNVDVKFPPSHTLFLPTNDKPNAPATDKAFWRRLLLIPFTLHFVDNPQEPNERQIDRNLKEKLQEELPGILNWLIRGALDYQEQGLNPPQVVLEASEEYRRDEDTLGEWIEQCCECDTDVHIHLSKEDLKAYAKQPGAYKSVAGTLFTSYIEWLVENGYCKQGKTPSQHVVGKELKKRFPHLRARLVEYFGVRLRPAL